MLCVFNHILSDSAKDHTVQRRKVSVIELSRLLVDLIGTLVVAKQALLVAYLSVVVRVLGAQHDSHV